jgi:DNA modification methylase
MTSRILIGDCRALLATLPDQSVQCCVTSPPYFGLRDYGVEGQIGLEPTPEEFVAEMVAVFREVWRVLRDDATLWLNLGDSYSSGGNGAGHDGSKQRSNPGANLPPKRTVGFAPKQLLGIPWRVAFALQTDGWYLRQDNIWSKPNPMPESVTDRCTKAHEYLFLLTKSPQYRYDADAIAEGLAESSIDRLSQPGRSAQRGSDRVPGKTNGAMKAVGRVRGVPPRHAGYESSDQSGLDDVGRGGTRNKRSVWTVATQPFADAHFATFPPALIEPCILAGCPIGGTVLDPFGGAGTTGLVAERLGRESILIELNPEYAALAEARIREDRLGPVERATSRGGRRKHKTDAPLFGEVAAI